MEYIYWLPSNIVSGKNFIDLASEQSAPKKNYQDYGYWSSVYGRPINQLQLTPALQKIVIYGRSISALFAIAYILLAAFIIYLIYQSYLFSLLTFIFLSFHKIIYIHGRQILADSGLNFFILLSFLFTLFFWLNFWENKKKASLLSAAYAGFFNGLAGSVKLNGLINLPFFTIISLLIIALTLTKKTNNKIKKIKLSLISLLIFTLLSFSIFYFFHPNIWKNPIKGITKFIDWRIYITKYYQDYFSSDSIKNPFLAIYYIFLRVPGYLVDVSSTGFIYTNEFGSQPIWPYLLINLTLFLTGIYSFIKKMVKNTNYFQTLEFINFIWSIVIIIFVALYLRLDWTRYYWPCFLPFLIINLSGLKYFITKIKLFWNKYHSRTKE
jgi:hypothetical protein